MRYLILSCIGFILSGCSLLFPPAAPKLYTFDVNPQPIRSSGMQVTLLVTAPHANGVYNTSQMVYSTKPYQIGYFAKNRWAATPPQMLQPLIIQTLQRTHRFSVIGTDSSARKYDYILNTQLLELQQDFINPQTSEVHLVLRAQLINVSSNNRVMATRQFTVVVPAPEPNPYGGVIATNLAVNDVLQQLARFCIDTLSIRHTIIIKARPLPTSCAPHQSAHPAPLYPKSSLPNQHSQLEFPAELEHWIDSAQF